MSKKIVLLVLFLLVATNLWAVKTVDVSTGVHNMGSTGTYASKSLNEDEVCIFCHTPHGGTANTPLWNRDLPVQTGGNEFRHYTSATLSGHFTGLSLRQISPESLLCMSCHDGTVALNSIKNASNRTGALPNVLTDEMTDTNFFGPGAVIGDYDDFDDTGIESDGIPEGRNLTDDHPISFSYTAAQGHADNLNQYHTDAEAKLAGIRFFGNQTTENRVECSSCHDPHIDYSLSGDANYTPFLRTPNTGSALCLACHIK